MGLRAVLGGVPLGLALSLAGCGLASLVLHRSLRFLPLRRVSTREALPPLPVDNDITVTTGPELRQWQAGFRAKCGHHRHQSPRYLSLDHGSREIRDQQRWPKGPVAAPPPWTELFNTNGRSPLGFFKAVSRCRLGHREAVSDARKIARTSRGHVFGRRHLPVVVAPGQLWVRHTPRLELVKS